MHDLFNPAGLSMLEDRQGAIAYGYVAHRVVYSRFVGRLSAALGQRFVAQLETLTGRSASVVYFADASALRACDLGARTHFEHFVAARRARLSSIAILTWPSAVDEASLALSATLHELASVSCDPLEFERALCNLVSPRGRPTRDLPQLWQVHAPRG